MSPNIQYFSQWQVPMFPESLVIRMTKFSVPSLDKETTFLGKIIVSDSIATVILKTILRPKSKTRMFRTFS